MMTQHSVMPHRESELLYGTGTDTIATKLMQNKKMGRKPGRMSQAQ
jgi:hypothetical protein